MAESFFATLEYELLAKRPFKTHAEARLAIFEYLEGFYNPHRLHSSIGYLSPVNFERRYAPRKRAKSSHIHVSTKTGEVQSGGMAPTIRWDRSGPELVGRDRTNGVLWVLSAMAPSGVDEWSLAEICGIRIEV
jgi:hypothetical protein